MTTKTHKTAVVLIPPEEVWGPVQEIRRRYDRNVRRWMPHITLIYPFVPGDDFAQAEDALRPVCAGIDPFDLRLTGFRWFEHGRASFTVWLAPEPAENISQLQTALGDLFPGFDDVRRYGEFVPHLSVGQAKGRAALDSMLANVREGWTPLDFRAACVSLIARCDPPEDVFRVERVVALGPGE